MTQSSKSPETIAQELLRMKARLEAGPRETEAPRARGMGFFEAILHHAGEPVAVLKDGVHVFVNPPYAALVGRSREDLLGLCLECLVAEDGRVALIQALEDLGETREETEVRIRLAVDPAGVADRSWGLQRFQQGGTTYVRVEPTQHRLSMPSGPFSALESTEHALALTLPNTRMVAVSPGLCDLLGLSGAALTRLAWSDLVAPDHLARLDLALGQGRRTGHAVCLVNLRCGEGTWLETQLEVMPWIGRTVQGDGVLVLARPHRPGEAAAQGEGDLEALGYQQVFQSMAEAYALHEIITNGEGRPVDYRFLEVNPAWEAFTGLTAEQVLGRTVLEVLPGTEPYWIDRYGQVALTGESASFEHFSAVLGKHFRVMAQSPRKGLFSALAVDITDDRRREEQLALLSRAVEQSPATIVITNPSGEIEYANPKFETLTGYTVQEALGKNPRILKSGMHRAEVYENLWKTLLRGETWRGDLCNRRKDQTLFWERAIISPILEGGRITHFLAVKEDITKERALEATRQRLLTALEQTEDALAVLDLDGTVLMVNQAMRRLMGCADQERSEGEDGSCDGSRLRAFLEGSAREAWEGFLKDSPDTPRSWRGRLAHTSQDGCHLILSATFQKVDRPDGQGHDLYCSLRDVTHEEALERVFRQNEKMDALGKLASGIAHDFNNVLATILAAAELLEWQIPENSPGRDKVEAIRLAGRRAQELNRRILSFTRKGEGSRSCFDLSAVVKEVVGLLKSTVPPQVELHPRLASSIWCLGDPNQILQVVMNLSVNAFHAMRPRGGLLQISLTEAVLEAEELPVGMLPGRYAVLEVIDQGEGIDPETQARVFEPFFTTKPEGEGTGLGLFVAHGIIVAHGGNIHLESALGEGTRVKVLLPCAEPLQVPQEGDATEDPTGEESILLVGGEVLWSALTSEGLRHYGYKVVTLQDPFEALERLRAKGNAVQALILDQNLKGMTPSALLKRVKRDNAQLPTLLLAEASGSLEGEDPGAGGHDELVLLPATPRDIARVMRRLLDARRPAEPLSETKSEAATPESPRRPLILLAEDSSVTRNLLRAWLQKAGYAVLEARDGQDAWERFQERGPQAFVAVLTDFVMPRMDGTQLVSRVRELDPTLPTLILSSMEDADSFKAALQVHASEYLTKPFTSKALLDCLGRLLGDEGTRRTAQRNQETIQAVRRAQQSLVPVPEADLPIFSLSQTLTDAGGDVLRCLRQEDGSILFVLADVAGHSVLSSYAVASFLGMLATFARETQSLPDLARRLNRSIQEGPFREIPVCTLLGRWEPERGRLHLLNAGIPHGLLLRRRTGKSLPFVVNGTPLGIFEDPMVEERVIWLEAGDRALFATDGIFEIRDEQGAYFDGQAHGHWTEFGKAPLDEALGQFVEAARTFGKGQLTDDLLVMAFEQPAPLPDDSLALWMPSKTSALDRACQRLKDHLGTVLPEEGLSASRRFDIILAARELLTNALFHGNAQRPDAEIHLRCRIDRAARCVELRVCDEGTGFDLARHRGPDDPLSERGRGIPFIRAIGAELAVEGGEACMTVPLEG